MQATTNTAGMNQTFLEVVEKKGPFSVNMCFQCRKCTNGCPATFAMDYYPDEIIRFVMMGLSEKALSSKTIWVCAACETCTARCPNGVKIAELMDCLKEMSIQRKVKPGDATVRAFHETFLKNIKGRGRVFEGKMLPEFMLKSSAGFARLKTGIFSDIKTGFKMVMKGRLKMSPPKTIHGNAEVDKILAEREER